ncbi:phosphatidate cytidylyltransferase [Polyrhizophydium stewartii]|uniref:Phosphatidate cytidylyltransferase n=1 Tax=Polyrhizophydium stewartii TaxID=2732419 RepID=A0ABR4N987_9FUNG
MVRARSSRTGSGDGDTAANPPGSGAAGAAAATDAPTPPSAASGAAIAAAAANGTHTNGAAAPSASLAAASIGTATPNGAGRPHPQAADGASAPALPQSAHAGAGAAAAKSDAPSLRSSGGDSPRLSRQNSHGGSAGPRPHPQRRQSDREGAQAQTHPQAHSHLPSPLSTAPQTGLPQAASAPASPSATAGPGSPTGGQQKVTLLADEPASKKWRNWWVRSFWTAIMVSGFVGILMAGHVWVIGLVDIIQTIVYREVISIGILPSKERQLPWLRSLHWYFLFSTNYFLYGESIIHYFKPVVFVDAFLMPLATHHRLISFLLYCIGLVNFVLNLKKGHYKFQFSHFCWTHMALLLVVVQSHFIINNIFEGLIWFVLPVSLVICNDIMAYICGFFWGRTPLIRISPKKTWEGFIGGFVATFFFAFFISAYLASWQYMTCPVENLNTNMNTAHNCPVNPVFIYRDFPITPAVTALIRWVTLLVSFVAPSLVPAPLVLRSISLMPLQLHALLLAAFASLIAPFGGFFASGVKRAFKIKDFGDSIPGHGGLTDRMDCQFIMGVFSFIYFQSFIGTAGVTVGTVLQSAVSYLTIEQQLELHARLGQYLAGQGVQI